MKTTYDFWTFFGSIWFGLVVVQIALKPALWRVFFKSLVLSLVIIVTSQLAKHFLRG